MALPAVNGLGFHEMDSESVRAAADVAGEILPGLWRFSSA
jgi:hypothetical protein